MVVSIYGLLDILEMVQSDNDDITQRLLTHFQIFIW